MKTASKRYSNQKGFSPAFIVVGVVILLVIAFVLFSFKKSTSTDSTNNQQPSTVSTTQPTNGKFDKIETDKYIFYYPKGYVVGTGRAEDGDILMYQNPNTQRISPEKIVLRSTSHKQLSPTPTYQTCLNQAENFRAKTDDQIKAEAVAGDEKSYGCIVTISSPSKQIGGPVVVQIKYLWYKSGTDYSIYEARAAYFSDNGTSDQAATLNASVDLFTLK